MRLGINKAAQRLLQVVTSILKKNFKNKTKCWDSKVVVKILGYEVDKGAGGRN